MSPTGYNKDGPNASETDFETVYLLTMLAPVSGREAIHLILTATVASVAIRKFARLDGGFGANFRIFSHTRKPMNPVCFLNLKFAPSAIRYPGELQIQHTGALIRFGTLERRALNYG